MRDLRRSIVFRARVRFVIYTTLLLLFGTACAFSATNTPDTSVQITMLALFAVAFTLIGLLAHFHYTTLDNYRMVRAILQSTSEGVLVTDRRNRIIFANEKFLEIARTDYETILGKDPGYFRSDVHEDAFFEAMWKSIHEEGVWFGEIWDKRGDGTLYSKDLTIRTVGGRKSNPRYHIGVFRDLSQYKTLREQSAFERYHFGPTNLPNERRIKEFMASNIEKDRLFQLHYIRITNYPYLVSVHTPEGFYNALKEVKERIEAMKESLILGQIDRETLLLIREEPHDPAMFKEWLKSLNQAFETPVASLMKFDVRTGIALYPDHGDDPEDLLTKATLAFDHTGNTSTKNHAVYDPDYHKTINDEYKMRDAIIHGLDEEEFSLVYHPINTGNNPESLFAVEALLRWHSDIYGDISPEVFIPVAEKFYLMNRIGDLVLKEALEHKAKLDGAYGKGVMMSINTSATQYDNDLLYGTLNRDMKSRSIDPAEIIIEITESSIMENLERTVEYLERLRDLGVRIALDDFGTGFSSLNYLRSMPINYVKIDREFVRWYPDHDDGTLAKTIIKVGNDLNLEVIAEGIETGEQAAMLEAHGCQYFQGYHFTRPLAFDALLDFIGDHDSKREQ